MHVARLVKHELFMHELLLLCHQVRTREERSE